jgi:hypothetical protein
MTVPPVLLAIAAVVIAGHCGRRLEANERRQERSDDCRSDAMHVHLPSAFTY